MVMEKVFGVPEAVPRLTSEFVSLSTAMKTVPGTIPWIVTEFPAVVVPPPPPQAANMVANAAINAPQ
jgi:hypothetical protein